MDTVLIVLLTFVLASNLVGYTVLFIGFYNKYCKRSELASMVAQYQVLPKPMSVKAMPYLLLFEGSVLGVGFGMLVVGKLLSSSLILVIIYLAYTALLLSVKLRKISIDDCGCYLNAEYKGQGVDAILLRNAVLLSLLILSFILSYIAVQVTFAMVVAALLCSALMLILLTAFEVLVTNFKNLQKLKVRHG